MKEIVKMSRLNGLLEKAFRLLNAELFAGELPTPIITVSPVTGTYAHYTMFNAWSVNGEGKREINISSDGLHRELVEILASLLHEMVHMFCDIKGIKDTSNRGVYHNKNFKKVAEEHGLEIDRHEKYGWTITKPAEKLIEFTLNHEELREISMNRVPDFSGLRIGGGEKSGGTATKNRNSHSIKYQCPVCGCSVRATKEVNIGCLDCGEDMIRVN